MSDPSDQSSGSDEELPAGSSNVRVHEVVSATTVADTAAPAVDDEGKVKDDQVAEEEPTVDALKAKLDYECQKNCALQSYLVNEIHRSEELERLLNEAKNEVRSLKRRVAELMADRNAASKSGSVAASIGSSPSTTGGPKLSNSSGSVVQSEQESSSSNTAKRARSQAADKSPRLPPKIEKAIETVAPALVNVRADTAPKDLLNRFVCRIFNDGELYYGYLVSYHKGYFQVVYHDGDSQKLSTNEVLLSLIDEEKIARKVAADCRKHYEKGTHLQRNPLPTIT